MVKQVFMPLVLKRGDDPDEHRRQLEKLAAKVLAAEQELNQALQDGFRLITQYSLEDGRLKSIVFVLHKWDDEALGLPF